MARRQASTPDAHTTDATRGPRPRLMQDLRSSPDLAAAAGLAVVAALAAAAMPQGSVLRLLVTLPVLLVVPGYLLLQALLVPARRPQRRIAHAALAVGISPPLVGLLALSTDLFGSFRPVTIVATITIACVAFAIVALVRRAARPGPHVAA